MQSPLIILEKCMWLNPLLCSRYNFPTGTGEKWKFSIWILLRLRPPISGFPRQITNYAKKRKSIVYAKIERKLHVEKYTHHITIHNAAINKQRAHSETVPFLYFWNIFSENRFSEKRIPNECRSVYIRMYMSSSIFELSIRIGRTFVEQE